MLTKTHILHGVLAVAIAHDLIENRKLRRKTQKVIDQNRLLEKKLDHAVYVAGYFAIMLDKHDVTFEEFDLVVVNTPMHWDPRPL